MQILEAQCRTFMHWGKEGPSAQPAASCYGPKQAGGLKAYHFIETKQ